MQQHRPPGLGPGASAGTSTPKLTAGQDLANAPHPPPSSGQFTPAPLRAPLPPAPAPYLPSKAASGVVSKVVGYPRQYPKAFAAIVIGLVAYGAYSIYAWRQPYEWSGTVEAHAISLGSRTGGRVKDVLVREGQTVKAGDVLVVLEAGDLDAQKEIAEADLEGALAALEKLGNGARPEEIAQATARVAAARGDVTFASAQATQERKEAARVNTLYAGGAAAAADRERTLSTANAAVGSVGAATAKAKEAEAALKLLLGGTRPEDIRAAKAMVAAARAKVVVLERQLAELTIRAQRGGRIETITVRPGDILGANATAATLLEPEELYVRVYVPETLIGKITPGQKVPITVDSFPKRSFTGVVEHINTVGEFTPRNLQTIEERSDEVFAARVALIDGKEELRAGMVAFVKVAK